MHEDWRAVPGYEGVYQVSNQARLKTVRSGRVRTGARTADGYLAVRLTGEHGRKRKHYLSRVVCEAFHGPPPSPAHVVAHRNGQKLDCRAPNLRWLTRAESCAHATALGVSGHHFGSTNRYARLTEAAVVEMRRRSQDGATFTQLAREHGVSLSAAYRAIVGLSWKHVA